ncbi:MAG: hypothetical protein HY520_01850 [Candidatus Aenigmarchaeota archaeon]|nr:hypothetical protein [Candidatus Aenigmarchaeota archaeon]
MVQYAAGVRKGLEFGASPRRWFPVFLVDALFFLLLVGMMGTNRTLLPSLVQAAQASLPLTPLAYAFLGSAALLGLAWFLIRAYVVGALIHQARKPREFQQSWRLARARYPSLLGSLVAVALVSVAAGMLPFLGWMFSVLAGLAFFFSLQSVMVRKSRALPSLEDSYRLFVHSLERVATRDAAFVGWVVVVLALGFLAGLFAYASALVAGATPLLVLGAVAGWITFSMLSFLLFFSPVFRMWLVLSVVSGMIALLFAVPALLVGLLSLSPSLLALTGDRLVQALLLFFLGRLDVLALMGCVFLVGSAIATAFTLKAQTEYYLQLTKKRFIIV